MIESQAVPFYTLQDLQAAVEKRNEIISQLTVNLQAALMSRDQVQLEAQQLTGQIQELQQQLHQVRQYSIAFRLQLYNCGKNLKVKGVAKAFCIVSHYFTKQKYMDT